MNYKSKSEMKRVESLKESIKKPREFWISPDKHDGLQMVFEKRVDECIHVREVIENPSNAEIETAAHNYTTAELRKMAFEAGARWAIARLTGGSQ